jgi:hypothetical protein
MISRKAGCWRKLQADQIKRRLRIVVKTLKNGLYYGR